MRNLPQSLVQAVELARPAQPSAEAASTCLSCLDLTSLNDDDTPEVIAALAARADHGALGHVAALCVYPRFVAQAFAALAGTGVNVATVINFPGGTGTVAQTSADTVAAVRAGANEIDIVLDHAAVRAGDLAAPAALLDACRAACGPGVAMKVILESAAFDDYDTLRTACDLALAHGADFLKTSTGKSARGGASLEAAAVMLEAIGAGAQGLKVSGGVKTVGDGARYIALVKGMRGADWVTPAVFRIGASGILTDILRTLGRDVVVSASSVY